MSNKECFLWICDKEYLGEAFISAKSAMDLHGSNVDRVLILSSDYDDDDRLGLFDQVFHINRFKDNPFGFNGETVPWYLYSAYMMRFATYNFRYDKIIYLDTDTFLCGTVYDVFNLLTKYDYAGVHAPGRFTGKSIVAEIPNCFPEINVGFNAWKTGHAVEEMFTYMCHSFKEYFNEYTHNDQGPLRDSLWKFVDRVRLYVMPTEYNFRFGFGGQITGKVKVLHGRYNGDIHDVANSVNASGGIRVWQVSNLSG